jgi:hypothetical protein
MANERALTKRILEKLRQGGGLWIKIHGGPYQQMGLPDIVGCYKGFFVGMEVKVPGKERTLTERQAQILRKIEEAGGYAGVVTSIGQAIRMLENIDEDQEPEVETGPEGEATS